MGYNWCSLIHALALSGGLISTVPEKKFRNFDELFLIKSLCNNFTKKCLFFTVSWVDFTIILCIFQQIVMISFTFHNGFDSIGLIFNFVAKMEKLPQISKASKSNVILLKQEGYKNVEISKRLKLSEASVSRILQRNKQNLSLSPLKKSGRPRTTTPRTDRKIKQLCQKQPFISSSDARAD